MEGKEKEVRSQEVPGRGHLACEGSLEGQEGGCDVGLYTGKEEGSEPMKRAIFCAPPEGPLTGDFLHRAPGLGCLPRERWCLSWAACTLPGFSLALGELLFNH